MSKPRVTSGGFFGLVGPALLLAAATSSAAVASPASAGSPAPPASSQDARAVRATEDAVKLMEANRTREAIQMLDRAIAADNEYWAAHYQLGRALGQLGDWQAARDALIRATELNPGHGHSHRLAALAAINVEDWEAAWDQAIRAQLAGEDMGQTLLRMYNLSPPPEDFEIRINAAPVFVADVDASTAVADIELPTNFNPQGPTTPGQRRGRASDLEDSALNQSSLDLIRLQRAMRNALAESPRLAVVLDPGRARFILSMQLTEISTAQPNSAEGYFRVIDIGAQEVVYRQPIALENLGSMADIVGKLRRYVTDLSAWLAERDAR